MIVTLSSVAPAGCSLRVRLRDADGNVWTEQSVAVAGKTEVEFGIVVERVRVWETPTSWAEYGEEETGAGVRGPGSGE